MEEEIWRQVPGSNGKYYISIDTPQGKCYSLWFRHGWRKKPYELSTKPDRKGYIYWGLTLNDERVTHQAARWIAITFPELVQNEYFEGAEIDHIIPLSAGGTNHPSNLRWVNRSGQMNNPLTRLHNSEARKGKHPSEKTREKMRTAHEGKALTEETRLKISQAHTGKKLAEAHKQHISQTLTGRKGHPGSPKQIEAVSRFNKETKSKPIAMLDEKGKEIKVFSSLAEASRVTGLNKANISHSALGDHKKCGGFRWAYKEKE